MTCVILLASCSGDEEFFQRSSLRSSLGSYGFFCRKDGSNHLKGDKTFTTVIVRGERRVLNGPM